MIAKYHLHLIKPEKGLSWDKPSQTESSRAELGKIWIKSAKTSLRIEFVIRIKLKLENHLWNMRRCLSRNSSLDVSLFCIKERNSISLQKNLNSFCLRLFVWYILGCHFYCFPSFQANISFYWIRICLFFDSVCVCAIFAVSNLSKWLFISPHPALFTSSQLIRN